MMCLLKPEVRQWRPKITGYVEEVVSQFNAADIQRMFRLSWAACDMLIKVISAAVERRQTGHARGKPAVSVEKKVFMFLYYMGTQASDYDIAHRFGVSDSTVFHCVNDIVKVLYEDMQSVFIRWPTGEYAERVIEGFRDKQGIEGVIGAIDGSHIRIACPHEDPADYVNRKNYHSIILQAVCDHNMSFTDVHVGWPGSVHDARVFRNSPLQQAVLQHVDSIFPGGSFLIGDAAYPLTGYMITPFKDTGTLTREKTVFNFCHSSTRMAIERAFGLLKGRFRRLQMLNVVCPRRRCQVVVVACILHNICLLSPEEISSHADEVQTLILEGMTEEVNNYQSYEHVSTDAAMKRARIAEDLSGSMCKCITCCVYHVQYSTLCEAV